MPMMPEIIQKYCDRYAVGPMWRVNAGDRDSINTVIVIPALAESERLFRTLGSISRNPEPERLHTMALCVVNNRHPAHAGLSDCEDNQKTLRILDRLIHGVMPQEGEREPDLFHDLETILENDLRLACVDASSPGREMPDKVGGVGLARKIGFDLALPLFDYKNERLRLLLSLDADTLVERNYVSAVRRYFKTENVPAAVVSFAHSEASNREEQAAILCYEIFLHYYVLGLLFAKSPYAYHSIGSTMACTAEAYAAVRGMNKRKAGEDFYFLNKLAKLGPIGTVTTTTVHPAPRRSDRVPFGTGRRISRFVSGGSREYMVYDPAIFLIVKDWLTVLDSWDGENERTLSSAAAAIHPSLESFLQELHFDDIVLRLKANSGSAATFRKHLSCWFDGFRTLRLINYLSRNVMPPMDMFSAVERMVSFMGGTLPVRIKPGNVPLLDEQQAILDCLRAIEYECGGTCTL